MRERTFNIITSIGLVVALLLVAAAAFAGTHVAAHHLAGQAAAATDPGSLLDLLRPIYDAVTGKHYALAGALGVIALVALLKRYAGSGKFGALVHSDLGGTLSALLIAMATAMATALGAPGARVTLDMMKDALLVGVGAAGGFAVLKNLLFEPLLAPLERWATARWPWVAPVFRIATWIFDKPDAVAEAEKAGAAAVAAHPAPGVEGTTGPAVEIK